MYFPPFIPFILQEFFLFNDSTFPLYNNILLFLIGVHVIYLVGSFEFIENVFVEAQTSLNIIKVTNSNINKIHQRIQEWEFFHQLLFKNTIYCFIYNLIIVWIAINIQFYRILSQVVDHEGVFVEVA